MKEQNEISTEYMLDALDEARAAAAAGEVPVDVYKRQARLTTTPSSVEGCPLFL